MQSFHLRYVELGECPSLGDVGYNRSPLSLAVKYNYKAAAQRTISPVYELSKNTETLYDHWDSSVTCYVKIRGEELVPDRRFR